MIIEKDIKSFPKISEKCTDKIMILKAVEKDPTLTLINIQKKLIDKDIALLSMEKDIYTIRHIYNLSPKLIDKSMSLKVTEKDTLMIRYIPEKIIDKEIAHNIITNLNRDDQNPMKF